MSTTMPPVEATEPSDPGPSLIQRTLRVFARPFRAWDGLETHSRWWFPMVLVAVVQLAVGIVFYDSVMVRTTLENMNSKIESGQLTQEQAEAFATAPVAKAINIVVLTLISIVVPLVAAFGLWFGVSFVLGTRFSYRLALEVSSWSSLVTVPALVLKFALAAWQEMSVNQVHLGLGALLSSDSPGKLSQAAAVLLDLIGPFTIWLFVVQVAGCVALSRAKRSQVAWVLGALYVGMGVLGALVTYLFAPGA